MLAFLSKWKKIVKKATSFQANILFSVIFFLFIFPVGLLAKKSMEKRFGLKFSKKRNSYWIKREEFVQDLDWARRQ